MRAAASCGPRALLQQRVLRIRRSVLAFAQSIDNTLAVAAVERKRRDFDFEMFAAGGDHAVGANHETRGGLQRNAAGIFESFSGFEHRLLADNARPAYLLAASMSVGDPPVARFQLHRLGAFIGDGDRVGPEEIIVL